jgi:membrane-anchored mycosin MYCP
VVVVAAASNDANNGNAKAYPAAYPSVVAVGAVQQDGSRADFSNTGDYLSVVAPGVGILSLGPRGPGHLVGDGTSYACPFVAGVAALVRAAFPTLTAAQVKRRLELTADHPPANMPDPQLGWGMVDPYAAMTQVLAGEPATARPAVLPPPPAATGWDWTWGLSIAIAGATMVVAFGLLTLTWVVPRGRRRRWRPADAESVKGHSQPPIGCTRDG